MLFLERVVMECRGATGVGSAGGDEEEDVAEV